MEKTVKLISKKYDENNVCKEVEVTYHFDRFRETHGTCIWCEYEGMEGLRLSHNNGRLENLAWTFMYFHASMYWLVLPLLMAGVVKINYKTSYSSENHYKNQILVELAEEYVVRPENDK